MSTASSKHIKNHNLATKIYLAKRAKKKDVFPSHDIPTLVEMAIDVVAENLDLYPNLDGIDMKYEYIKKEVSVCLILDYLEGPPRPGPQGGRPQHWGGDLLGRQVQYADEEYSNGEPWQFL